MELSRRGFMGLGLASLGVGLSGCAREAPATPAASTPTVPSAAPAAPAVPRPFVVGAPGRPLTRDPAGAWDAETFRLSRQVLETLLGVDPDTGAPTPQLVESHTVSDDGLTHEFRLLDGVVFEDGAPCDAAAVAANVTRWSTPPTPVDGTVAMPSPFVSAFGGHAGTEETAFAGVETPDERTVRLRLRSRLHHLPAALSSPPFAISSPGSWDRTVRVGDADVVTPAGTGAFRWATAEEAAAHAAREPAAADPADVTLLMPADRHRGDAPATGPVAVHAWGRASTRLRELRRGTADVIDVVAPSQLRPLVEAGTQVLPRDPLAVLYLGMNLAHPQLRSQHLRQAVAHAVDRGRLASSDVFLEGTAQAHDLVPPALGVGDEEAEHHDLDPDRAERLREMSGYAGEPLEFLYPLATGRPSLPEPERVYAMVAADLGAVGITVTPVPVPDDEDYLRAVVSRPTRALHLMGRGGAYRDPHAFLEPIARSGRAETNYDNPRVVRDLAAAAAEPDDDRRRELHRGVVRAMALDLPALPLVYPISALATGPRVASYPTSPQLDEPFARIGVTDA